MRRVLLDTAVFVYARGREHPYREPCRQLLRALERGAVAGEASVELVQEFAHLLRRRGFSGDAVREESRSVAALCVLHGFTDADLARALDLLADVPALGVRDAVHAATALNRGIAAVVSPDRAYDEVGGLERIDPRDAAAILGPLPPEPRRSG